MNKMNIYSALKDAPMDEYAGIKIVKLTGDKDLSVYVADIAPHTALTPHYHTAGIDAYQILLSEISFIDSRPRNPTLLLFVYK
jgi:hypothetical protein